MPAMAAEVVQVLHGGPIAMKTYPEASSQSFKAGQPVILTSGKVVGVTSTWDVLTIGIAGHDASGVTDNPVSVILLTSQTVLSLSRSTSVSAIAEVGTSCTLAVASNKITCLPGQTTAEQGYVLDLDGRDAVGAALGRYLVIVYPAMLAVGVTQ